MRVCVFWFREKDWKKSGPETVGVLSCDNNRNHGKMGVPGCASVPETQEMAQQIQSRRRSAQYADTGATWSSDEIKPHVYIGSCVGYRQIWGVGFVGGLIRSCWVAGLLRLFLGPPLVDAMELGGVAGYLPARLWPA